jgi:hypothetical protein
MVARVPEGQKAKKWLCKGMGPGSLKVILKTSETLATTGFVKIGFLGVFWLF